MRLKSLIIIIPILLLWACDSKENYFDLAIETGDSLVFTASLDEEFAEGEEYYSTSITNVRLAGIEFSSDEYARSGSKSIKLDSANQYGLNFAIENLRGGEFIELSVWQKMGAIDGAIEAKLKGENTITYYRTYPDPVDLGEDGWQKHYLNFVVGTGVESVIIHVFSGGEIVYFDDLEVKIFNEVPQNDLALNMSIELPDSAKSQLDEYIYRSQNADRILSSVKKYVAGELIYGSNNAAIKMRLKGDWNDHLFSGKASLRIKIEGEMGVEGMKNFSIQHPKTRKYLNEWVIHELAESEDVLTTSYSFSNITIDGINHGVYAVEEHFDKQLLESRNRREGPILKFDETSYWSASTAKDPFENLLTLPYFQESRISVFKKNRTRKSTKLNKQFLDGQNLLQLFKDGHVDVQDLFDIDQLAKFYALMEIAGNGHGLRWHNRRFYFNPVTEKLEHIAYDISPFHFYPDSPFIMKELLLSPKQELENSFECGILYNAGFKARFLFHLNRMTDKNYFDKFFAEINGELEVNRAALEGEFANYKFEKSMFYDHAAMLKAGLTELDSLWDEKIKSRPNFIDWVEPQSYGQRADEGYNNDFLINAYQQMRNGLYEVELENYHSNPVTIHAYSSKDQEGIYYLDTAIQISGFTDKVSSAQFNSVLKPKRVYYTIANNPKVILSSKVSKWPKPKGGSTRMSLEEGFKLISPYYKVNGNKVVFNRNVIIDELIFIPAQYEVEIQAGSQINLDGEGGIIITNSLSAIGTRNNPIRIISESGSSNGITVLNGDYAILKYVEFNGLSNLDYGNWELTGAITIYETETIIENCIMSGNHSEDGLNIIRSNFEIKNLTISDTYSDGFDADFCTGIISYSNFSNTGNDCIDFSGSKVTIQNIEILNSGDKGISGGEASHLTLKNIRIIGAITGIASKDASDIKGSEITIDNVEYGFAAFRKKPEYDYATMDLSEVKIKNAIEENLIGKGSSITINGKYLLGQSAIDIDSLYARFE